jgi:hypothetical protein
LAKGRARRLSLDGGPKFLPALKERYLVILRFGCDDAAGRSGAFGFGTISGTDALLSVNGGGWGKGESVLP